MGGEERAQRLGQKFGERVGVGQHPDLAGEPAGIGAEVLAQALGLAQDGARVLQQRAAGLGRRHALAPAHQKRGAERLLHVADARRGGGERQMRAFGAVRDAARLDDVAKQAEIGEIKAHGVEPSCLTKAAYVKSSLYAIISAAHISSCGEVTKARGSAPARLRGRARVRASRPAPAAQIAGIGTSVRNRGP